MVYSGTAAHMGKNGTKLRRKDYVEPTLMNDIVLMTFRDICNWWLLLSIGFLDNNHNT